MPQGVTVTGEPYTVGDLTYYGSNVTISVGSAAQSFAVENFNTNDKIEFAESVSVVESESGFVATFANGKKTSISGMDLADISDSTWNYDSANQTAIFGKTYLAGYRLSDGGKLTLKNAAQDNVVSIVDSKNKTISAHTYSANRIVDGKLITLTSAFKGTLKATNYTKVDASAAVNAIKISGGAGTPSGAEPEMIRFTGAKATTSSFTNPTKAPIRLWITIQAISSKFSKPTARRVAPLPNPP